MTAMGLAGLGLKGLIVMMIFFGISLMMRKSSAAKRHAVSVAAMVSLLALPLLLGQSIRMSVPISSSLISPQTFKAMQEATKEGQPKQTVSPSEQRQSFVSQRASGPRQTVVGQSMPMNQLSRVSQYKVLVPKPKPLNWPLIFVRTWFLLGGVVVLRWFWGLVGVARLMRAGREWIPDSLPLLCDRMGIRRQVKTLLCPRLSVPATIGIMRPVILLPVQATEWSESRMSVVLIHELAHIRRCDWLWQSLSQLACAIHVFNPLVWLGAKRQRAESELAGDDLVIQYGIEPTDYASQLLDIARSINKNHVPAAICMARKPAVESRIRAIIDHTRRREGVKHSITVGMVTVSCLIVVPVGIALPGVLGWNYDETLPTFEFPSNRSKEIEPGVFLAENGIAELPNGLRVRLVAITPDLTWTPAWTVSDKDIKDRGPFSGRGNWHPFHPEVDQHSRQFVFQFDSNKSVDLSTSGAIVAYTWKGELLSPDEVSRRMGGNTSMAQPRSGADLSMNGTMLRRGEPTYGFASIRYLNVWETEIWCNYRMAVATGKWETVQTLGKPDFEVQSLELDKPLEPSNSDDRSGTPCYFIDKKGRKTYAYVLPWTDPNKRRSPGESTKEPSVEIERQAVRVRFLDQNNQELKIVKESWNHPLTRQAGRAVHYIELSDASAKQCAKIEIQTRPFQYIEFRGVQLRPGILARMPSTGADQFDDYTKVSSDGYIATIGGVNLGPSNMRFWDVNSGSVWLRPDGRPSFPSQPIRVDKPIDLIGWGESMPVLFNISVAKETENKLPTHVSTVYRVEGDLKKVKGYRPYAESGPGLIPEVLVAPFTLKADEVTVWVGISEKPWTTLARMPVDMGNASKLSSGSNEDGKAIVFNDLQIIFGEWPTVIKRLNGKTTRTVLSEVPLTYKVAKRVVAVMKNGDRRVINQTDIKVDGEKTAKLRIGSQGKINPINLEDVRAIELQTRPYEWLKFEHVAITVLHPDQIPISPGGQNITPQRMR